MLSLAVVRAVQPADRRSEFVSFWVIVFEMVRQVRFLCDLLVLTGLAPFFKSSIKRE